MAYMPISGPLCHPFLTASSVGAKIINNIVVPSSVYI